MTEYRDIPGFPGYRVGDDGTVWTSRRPGPKNTVVKPWRQLKPARGNRRGYLKVALGAHNNSYVHTLVLIAFVGPCPPGMECCHKDDVSTNNALSNLRWGTRKQNMADAVKNGRVPKGTKHWNWRHGRRAHAG